MTKELVTIAIPMFNAENYIEKSLCSALAQTYDNIEILIVDDASTDNSKSIVSKIASEHPWGDVVRMLCHEINKGVSEARNTLLDNAKGKYIIFLDSDDALTNDCVEHLYNIAVSNDDDAVFSTMQAILSNGNLLNCNPLPTTHKSGRYSLCAYNYKEKLRIGNTMCNILYRTGLIRNSGIHLRRLTIGEDTFFNMELMPFIERFSTTSKITYLNLIREGSLSDRGQTLIELDKFLVRNKSILETKQYLCKMLDKPYFNDMLNCYMIDFMYIILALIKKRKNFRPVQPKEYVQELSRFPLSFSYILCHAHKGTNLFMYSFGILPYNAKCIICDIYFWIKRKMKLLRRT